MDAAVSCLHGSWKNGICECESGYYSTFQATELYPIYCGQKEEDILVINLRNGYEILDFLHYTAMSVTVALAVESFLAFVFFLYTLLDSCLLGRKIEKAKKKLEDFKRNQIRRDSTENLNVELWYPDLKVYRCINDPDFTIEKAMEEKEKSRVLYSKVITSYKPRDSGELRLHVGDTITDVVRLAKGWCKGKVNGKTGFYPEAYAEIFEPTESDLEGPDGNVTSDKDNNEANDNRKETGDTTDTDLNRSEDISDSSHEETEASDQATGEKSQDIDDDTQVSDKDASDYVERAGGKKDTHLTVKTIRDKYLKVAGAERKISRNNERPKVTGARKIIPRVTSTSSETSSSSDEKSALKVVGRNKVDRKKGNETAKRSSTSSKKGNKATVTIDSKRSSTSSKKGNKATVTIDSKRSGISSKKVTYDTRKVDRTRDRDSVKRSSQNVERRVSDGREKIGRIQIPMALRDLEKGAAKLKKPKKPSIGVEDFVFSSDDTN